MSAKRKQKLRDREARLRKLRQHHQSAKILSAGEINIQKEVDYIVGRAADHDARCVSLGALTFFSTESGDAWMLDVADGLALCLARAGVAQPVRIIEADTFAAVDWDRTFAIEGDNFTTIEKKTGRATTSVGYPMQAISAAIQRAKETGAQPFDG